MAALSALILIAALAGVLSGSRLRSSRSRSYDDFASSGTSCTIHAGFNGVEG